MYEQSLHVYICAYYIYVLYTRIYYTHVYTRTDSLMRAHMCIQIYMHRDKHCDLHIYTPILIHKERETESRDSLVNERGV